MVSFAHGYHGLNRGEWQLLRIFGNIEIAEVFACLTPLNACNLSFRVQIGFIAKLKTPFKFSPDYPRARPGWLSLASRDVRNPTDAQRTRGSRYGPFRDERLRPSRVWRVGCRRRQVLR